MDFKKEPYGKKSSFKYVLGDKVNTNFQGKKIPQKSII